MAHSLLSRRHCRWYAALVLVLFASSGAQAANEQQYREFQLGAATADIMVLAGASPRDLKTLHTRPALLQELSWRPAYVSSSAPGGRDSVRTIVFSFMDDRLHRIAVVYDSVQTEGLTPGDMVAALTKTYGPPSALPRPTRQIDSLSAAMPVARWVGDAAAVVLNHTAYSRTFSLVIASTALDAQARQAQASAVALDVREAPAREAARAAAAAAAAKADAAETRHTNKEGFRP